jgi:hypothetical protein
MALRWLRRRSPRAAARRHEDEDTQYLEQFVATRTGVEAYVEPRTTVTEPTVVLVAHDGEWTRRRVPSPEWVHAFARKQGIASFDAQVAGYPSRMREWNRRRSEQLKKLDIPDDLGGLQ